MADGDDVSNALCSEATTKIIIGIILSIYAIGFFYWLLFTLAVYMLPVIVGVSTGFAAYHHGYGIGTAVIIAVVAEVVARLIGQIALSLTRTPLLRGGIALTFALPAAAPAMMPSSASPSLSWSWPLQQADRSGRVCAGTRSRLDCLRPAIHRTGFGAGTNGIGGMQAGHNGSIDTLSLDVCRATRGATRSTPCSSTTMTRYCHHWKTLPPASLHHWPRAHTPVLRCSFSFFDTLPDALAVTRVPVTVLLRRTSDLREIHAASLGVIGPKTGFASLA